MLIVLGLRYSPTPAGRLYITRARTTLQFILTMAAHTLQVKNELDSVATSVAVLLTKKTM